MIDKYIILNLDPDISYATVKDKWIQSGGTIINSELRSTLMWNPEIYLGDQDNYTMFLLICDTKNMIISKDNDQHP